MKRIKYFILVFLFSAIVILPCRSNASDKTIESKIKRASSVYKASFLKIDNIRPSKINNASGCSIGMLSGLKFSDIIGTTIIIYLLILSLVAARKKRNTL